MKTVIFDFDGTIADTFIYVEETLNKFAPKYGYEPFSHAEFLKLRDLGMKEIVKKYRISRVNLLRMVHDSHKYISTKIDEVKVFSGVKDLIADLRDEGVVVVVISTNSKKNIEIVLEKNGIDVDAILTSLLPFGKDRKILKFLNSRNFAISSAVYVGDEVRDVETANRIGLKIVSVTWGYNSEKSLKKVNSLIAKTPNELRKFINQK